ncbi:MAG: hypothetical protein GC136_10700 [Alphaproteobacteria bacterium]|nr:hypothetical protein [Alphaproteobacteria bacterium]
MIQGTIRTYSDAVSAGVITAQGKDYVFMKSEWLSAQPPAANMNVTFEKSHCGKLMRVRIE